MVDSVGDSPEHEDAGILWQLILAGVPAMRLYLKSAYVPDFSKFINAFHF